MVPHCTSQLHRLSCIWWITHLPPKSHTKGIWLHLPYGASFFPFAEIWFLNWTHLFLMQPWGPSQSPKREALAEILMLIDEDLCTWSSTPWPDWRCVSMFTSLWPMSSLLGVWWLWTLADCLGLVVLPKDRTVLLASIGNETKVKCVFCLFVIFSEEPGSTQAMH